MGASPDNLAITAVRAAADRLIVSVRNTATRARETRVHAVADGRPAGETTVAVGPNQSVEATLPAVRGIAATVTIDDPEGVQADNTRYVVLEAGTRPTLVVVTATGDLDREAFYVHQALVAGTSNGQAFEIVGVGGAELSKWSAERLAGSAAVVLLSTRGLERRGRDVLAGYAMGGGGMLIAIGPEIDGEVIGDVLGAGSPLKVVTSPERGRGGPEPLALAPADARHPIFQTFGANAASLGLVKFHSVARISGATCQTLARFTTGETAFVDCVSGEGRALVVASDLNNRWNDFPLHATFVPFLHEAIRYLSSAKGRGREYLVGDAPAGVPPVPGIASIADDGRPRHIAINVDSRESEPARISIEEFQSAVTRLKDFAASEARTKGAQQEDRQHLWQYAIVMMIAALAVEGVIASRTA